MSHRIGPSRLFCPRSGRAPVILKSSIQAAAYLYYIGKNHSFSNGNKRTGLAAALTALEWNGLPYRSIRVREGEVFVNSVTTSKLDPGEEIQRIAWWLEPRPSKPQARRRR